MEAQPRELVLYVTDQGDVPFETWFLGLRDRQARIRIRKRLDRVEMGNLGDYKSVGSGVFELRIDYGSGYRVYFAFSGSTIVLLLCGGDKTTQDRDILVAKQYWSDFQANAND
ncbi:MAG: type II toxin-antitoxin system RelE/ParE family toxin [Leptolyngbya sp. UWPOB_LEPTO1]|uniref:type II toxin-antitoxin system RelE/ParE family toxin n=1 Tax=Leptolyngbya sp. UWPOB_LEPTO1 TaxID=2815653 RepID=UPI001AD037B1|nr:type II toxin-antitoxin system RelE/ParE family toxin [Leptolyngbya sp. UWPOB_LEPTO1]MBN8559869.1 type II toxin-antitoxin system RelE/ParE family toxin [Leptolyngbya sp. UWPOB_LEPTO1]